MKKTAIILLLLVTGTGIYAQQNKKKPLWGVSGSADFGRYNDRVSIEPSVAYPILKKIYLGIGASFMYYNTDNIDYKIDNNKVITSTTEDKIWFSGGFLFLRYLPFVEQKSLLKNVFLQASVEALYGNGRYKNSKNIYSYSTENYTPFLSIGYKQPLSDKLSLSAIVAFKLNNETDSPYRNPVIRIGFEF